MNIPYKVFSHYSLQEAYTHIDSIVEKAFEIKIHAIALTDINTVSGMVEFLKEIDKRNKKSEHKVLGIVGCTFKVFWQNIHGYITVLAKNKDGYHTILELLSKCQYINSRYGIKFEELINIDKTNIILIDGGINSLHHNSVLSNLDKQYLQEKIIVNMVYSKEYTGSDLDAKTVPEGYFDYIQGTPVFYINKEDQLYQQVIICGKHKIDIESIEKEAEQQVNSEIYNDFQLFFKNNHCYLHENNSDLPISFLKQFTSFSLNNEPQLPKVEGINDPDEELVRLCREGWKSRKIAEKTASNPQLKEVYTNRIKEELATFKLAKLASYMLIIRDFMVYAKGQGANVGLRGSAVGCLVSYLVGIIDIDPVIPDPTLPYDPAKELLFSRFLNKGRFSEGNMSIADADADVPISFRERLIEYFKKKYGKDRVSYIVTYGRLDGRGAIKEVFRVLKPCPDYIEMSNIITKKMVDAAKVQDVLEDLKEKNPKYNIIQYNIDHIPEMKEFYQEFKFAFDVASKLTNTIKTQGRHAAGIIIGKQELWKDFPVLVDSKTGENILAYEMEDAEYVGAVKYDILGVAALEKIAIIQNMIQKKLSEPINIYHEN